MEKIFLVVEIQDSTKPPNEYNINGGGAEPSLSFSASVFTESSTQT